MFRNLLLSSLLVILASCTTGKVRHEEAPPLSPVVQQKLDQARGEQTKGNTKGAIALLSDLHDDKLTPLEKANKYNLKGVFLFSQTEWEKALANFEVAKKYVSSNSILESQVWLNIASVRYKQGLFAELKQSLDKIDIDALPEAEVQKFAQLKLAWALKYQRHYEIVETSIILLRDSKTIEEVQNSVLKERLLLSFKALSDSEKNRLLEKFKDESWIPLAYLAEQEAEARYFKGDADGARDVISWLSSRFKDKPQIMAFVDDFDQRLDSSNRISMNSIGVVLPLSGDKSSYGQKALMGIEAALKTANLGREIEIFTKDSLDSASVGTEGVRDLIQRQRVPMIIGGLFPETAKAEYLEAKRWGVLYVSLSPIYLPREEKNHLLIEVQGSIESQVNALVSDEMLTQFGRRIGVVYPQGESGKAYADEFWRAVLVKNLQMSAVASYPKGTMDFRETIQHFLGLRFPRERAEELEIFKDAYSQERSSIRRIQNLPPALDFDWVFVASYPHEALSLIPTFGYYDARDIKIFGGPSWATKTIINEQKNLGRLYFVGENPADLNQEFFQKFQEIYGKPPTLIESLGYEGAKLSFQLLKDGDISERSKFDQRMKNLGKLEGLTTPWELQDGLWIKKMQPLAIKQGEIQKVF